MSNENLFAGTPVDGFYYTTQGFSKTSTPGTWNLKAISITDQCGNTTNYARTGTNSTLSYPQGIDTTLVITNTNISSNAILKAAVTSTLPAPVITSFSISPAIVDVTSTNVTATVTVTSGSNITYFYCELTDSNQDNYESGDYNPQNPLAPGVTGTFTATITFSGCDAPGLWSVDYLDFEDGPDANGNYNDVYYYPGNFPPQISSTTLTIINPSHDSTPPQMSSLALSSTVADVTNGDATITATIIATDNMSGVQQGSGVYSSTNGDSFSLDFYNQNPATSGTFIGTISVNTCSLPGVYTLNSFTVRDACGNHQTYGGNGRNNLPLPAGNEASLMVVNGTSTSGAVLVTILPVNAEFEGANWYLDSGTASLQSSGDIVYNVTPGLHTVNFTNAFAYHAPAPLSVMVAAGPTTYVTGTYTSTVPGAAGSLQVLLTPASITGSGAFWNVDNGPLQSSGATVAGLSNGSHTVNFSDVNGCITPAPQIVAVSGSQTTMTTGTYSIIGPPGNLTVDIEPFGAVNAGAQFNVDGGLPLPNATTVNGLEAISHTINFVGGGAAYAPPASVKVAILSNQTITVTGTFTPLVTGSGSLIVNIQPTTLTRAQWSLDGGPLQFSGATINGVTGGAHTLSFTTINGFATPPTQSITILPDETVVDTGTYATAQAFTGGAASFAGVSGDARSLLTLSVAATGKFSGKLATFGAPSVSMAGEFTSTGAYVGTAGVVPYFLQLTGSTPGTLVLTGSANGRQITALPAAYAKGQTVAELGKYTVLLAGTDPGLSIPQGSGYATLTIGKTGGGSITGKLADGASFSAASILVNGTGGHELVIFDPNLYGKKGLLSGVLNFGTPAAGQLAGALSWTKPVGKPLVYPNGFGTTLFASGALFAKSAPLPFTSGTVAFSAGGLATSGSDALTLSAKGAATIAAPDTDKVKLTISTATGAMTGSFQPAGAAKPLKFAGVLLQTGSTSRAAGYFLNNGLSGNVSLPDSLLD